MLKPCEHCAKKRILVARVRSELIDMRVCHECSVLAARLLSQFSGADGELTIEELNPHTAFMFELSRN